MIQGSRSVAPSYLGEGESGQGSWGRVGAKLGSMGALLGKVVAKSVQVGAKLGPSFGMAGMSQGNVGGAWTKLGSRCGIRGPI